jgi:hypothetical protein
MDKTAMDWSVLLVEKAKEIPQGQAGVYLLFIGDLLDYVGQSDDVRRRLNGPHHVYDRQVHTLIAFIQEEAYEPRLNLERYFNNKYNPPNSFTGTEKQSADSKYWRHASAQARREAWRGPNFEEFPISLNLARQKAVVELTQLQFNNNAMGVPSVIVLKAKDIRKS